MALSALVVEAADVQAKMLDLVEKLGPLDAQNKADLDGFIALVLPSLRGRVAEMAGTTPSQPTAPDVAQGAPAPHALAPVADAPAALALFLQVLENPRDPVLVKKTVDGISRFGAALRAAPIALSPLKKHAGQLWDKPDHGVLCFKLAAFGRALSEGVAVDALAGAEAASPDGFYAVDRCFAHVFHRRNAEVILQTLAGHALPMLSTPTDSAGFINPLEPVRRLHCCRAEKIAPWLTDLLLALLRLAALGRSEALKNLTAAKIPERAYALDAEEKQERDPEFWAAAWAARHPCDPEPAIVALFDLRLTDCGRAARCGLSVTAVDRDPYRYVEIDAPVETAVKEETDILPAICFVIPERRLLFVPACGNDYVDVA